VEPHPVRALVAGHGTFAAGIISAVDQITGLGGLFVPFSNADLGASDIRTRIADALDRTGARVVFTDLPAGSCTMAMRRLVRERPGLVLVTGVNVPLLLDFAMQAAEPAEAVRAAVERARTAMAVHEG
jgi:mannose/fructose-specific phosphotransferase system component IIA